MLVCPSDHHIANTEAFRDAANRAAALADDLSLVNTMIRERMASEHAPRIPEVTAHLVEAGGKRVRPMLTLAAARTIVVAQRHKEDPRDTGYRTSGWRAHGHPAIEVGKHARTWCAAGYRSR